MEINLKHATEISESGKNLDPSVFNNIEVEQVAVVTLSELSSIENFGK